jgi:hypothetical protein
LSYAQAEQRGGFGANARNATATCVGLPCELPVIGDGPQQIGCAQVHGDLLVPGQMKLTDF